MILPPHGLLSHLPLLTPHPVNQFLIHILPYALHLWIIKPLFMKNRLNHCQVVVVSMMKSFSLETMQYTFMFFTSGSPREPEARQTLVSTTASSIMNKNAELSGINY